VQGRRTIGRSISVRGVRGLGRCSVAQAPRRSGKAYRMMELKKSAGATISGIKLNARTQFFPADEVAGSAWRHRRAASRAACADASTVAARRLIRVGDSEERHGDAGDTEAIMPTAASTPTPS